MRRATWMRTTAAAMSAALLLGQLPAIAQPAPAAPPPAAAQPAPAPPAAAQPAAAQPAPAATPSEADTKKATALFLKGSDFFKQKKYALALDQFKQSYAAVPSPNSRLYIARCLAALGETRDAYLEFDHVIEEAELRARTEPKYAPTRDSARVERDELAPRLALLTVSIAHAGPETKLRVGGQEIPRDHWDKPIPLNPGAVEVVATNGGPFLQQSVTLALGEKRTVTLDVAPETGPIAGADAAPAPAAPATGGRKLPLRTMAYAAGGVGVIGFGMFAIAGAMSNATYSDLKDACGNGPCPASRQDDVSAGKTQQTVANVGLVLGIVGVAAGATLFVVSLKKNKNEAPPPTAPAPSPAPASAELRFGPGYAGIAGTF